LEVVDERRDKALADRETALQEVRGEVRERIERIRKGPPNGPFGDEAVVSAVASFAALSPLPSRESITVAQLSNMNIGTVERVLSAFWFLEDYAAKDTQNLAARVARLEDERESLLLTIQALEGE